MQETIPMKLNANVKSILLVDDDVDDHDFFYMALQEVNTAITFHTAFNGEDALQFLKSCSSLPDFIFLDLNMPLVNGKQFLKLFKQQPEWAQIPVAIYSTTASEKDIRDTQALGADYFITKPSCIKSIAEQLQNLLVRLPVGVA